MNKEEIVALSAYIADKLMEMYYPGEFDSDNKSDEDWEEFRSIYDIVFEELSVTENV